MVWGFGVWFLHIWCLKTVGLWAAAPRALSAVGLSVLPTLPLADEAHTLLSEMKTSKPQSPGPKPCQPLPLLSYSSQ